MSGIINAFYDRIVSELVERKVMVRESDFISSIAAAKDAYQTRVNVGRKLFGRDWDALSETVDTIATGYTDHMDPGIYLKNHLADFKDDATRGEAAKLFTIALRKLGNGYGAWAEKEFRQLAVAGPATASK